MHRQSAAHVAPVGALPAEGALRVNRGLTDSWGFSLGQAARGGAAGARRGCTYALNSRVAGEGAAAERDAA